MQSKTLKNTLASKDLYDVSIGKEKELKILLGFLRRLQFHKYSIEKSERPDFFLKFSNETLKILAGVEITFYYSEKGKRGSLQAKFVERWKKFATTLRYKLDECGAQYLYGSIHFKKSDFRVLDKFNHANFISEIIDLVRELKETRILDDFSKSPFLQEHVDHIYLKDVSPESGILWWPAHLQSGELKEPGKYLREIVTSKNKLAKSYSWKSAHEKWLLIHCESIGISDTIGNYADPEIQQELGILDFDRVYVWNKFLESIDEIYPNFIRVFTTDSKILHRKLYPPNVQSFIFSPS